MGGGGEGQRTSLDAKVEGQPGDGRPAIGDWAHLDDGA